VVPLKDLMEEDAVEQSSKAESKHKSRAPQAGRRGCQN
jgi:hypothetical protein